MENYFAAEAKSLFNGGLARFVPHPRFHGAGVKESRGVINQLTECLFC